MSGAFFLFTTFGCSYRIRMKVHKEGYKTLIYSIIILGTLSLFAYYYLGDYTFVKTTIYIFSIVFFLLILQFFRHPRRMINEGEKTVLSPADGKVVVIEEVQEEEYFKDKRIQVSVFMSPVNVHINWFPISGVVKYAKYHPGKYLVAWHPKSSTHNERTTIVVEHPSRRTVLMRQIAGALARRIVYYCKEDDIVAQGDAMGFIKFGSRVDLLLPPDAKIQVNLNDKVKGGKTIIATFD